MKRTILILLIASNLFTQEKVTKVEYECIFGNLNKTSKSKSYLYVNENLSFFSYLKKFDNNHRKEEDYHKDNTSVTKITINNRDSIGDYQYIDYNNNKIYERRYLLVDYRYIKDNLEIPKWELLDSVRVIDNYKCNFAKTNYYGREYYAWYTIEIPINKGPWKLNGLPGLIIYAYDSEKKIFFETKKISFNIDNNKFTKPKIDNKNSMTLEEFFILEEKEVSSIRKKLSSYVRSLMDVGIEEEEDISFSQKRIGERLERNILKK